MNRLERISTPVRIVTDTTRRCNLSCWYCHSSSGPQYKGPEIKDRSVSEIFQAAEENKVFDITLTGGEPLLWAGLAMALEESHSLIYPALQLITNATLVTKTGLKEIENANIQRVCVSLDGTSQVHERNRGKGTYERTINGIELLREAIDNITVISVLDRTNYEKWPELTKILIEMGVKQHHLAPVCFAGNAMKDYRGLTEEEFDQVRGTVDRINPYLPKDFILRFNDILVHKINSRKISMQSFTEAYKGWHVVIRPDGKVNSSIKAWGRSWRDNETIGNINESTLREILMEHGREIRPFFEKRYSREEELGRKFHFGKITQKQIDEDLERVRGVELGFEISDENSLQTTIDTRPDIFTHLEPDLVDNIKKALKTNRSRYRIREEDGFGFFFDRETFDITLLTKEELKEIENL